MSICWYVTFVPGGPDTAISWFFSFGEPERFQPILDNLRDHDPYLVCADFEPYCATEARAAELYRDPIAWSRKALYNIAGASRFSSDETIRQYAAEIWGLQPVNVELKSSNGEG